MNFESSDNKLVTKYIVLILFMIRKKLSFPEKSPKQP